HGREELSGQPDAAHDIDVEKSEPDLVRDVDKRLWLEDADIIDEDIDFGELVQQTRDVFFFSKVGGNAGDPGIWDGMLQCGDGAVHGFLSSPIDDDSGVFFEKLFCNSQSNTCC